MAWISIGMTTLLCVSCGAGQTTQLFHSFAFDSGPHIVCVACSNSQTRHVFDEAAAAQHSANIDNVNYTQSRVTASEQRIIDLDKPAQIDPRAVRTRYGPRFDATGRHQHRSRETAPGLESKTALAHENEHAAGDPLHPATCQRQIFSILDGRK